MVAESARIVVIGPTPPPVHGVSISMQTLLKSAIAERFQLLHLDTADRRGIHFVDKPDWHDVVLFVKQFMKIVVLMARHQPHLLYIPISQSRIGFLRDSLFMIPAFLMRCPVVVHLHGANLRTVYDESGYIWKRYFDLILLRVTRFVVLGEMLKPIFEKWTTARHISVVPNGISQADCQVRPPTNDSQSNADHSLFRVLALSTLSRAKGVFVLLETISLVCRQYEHVRLYIAGPWWGTTTESEAMAYIAERGIGPHVNFVGQLTGRKKTEFFRSGDVFIFPGLQQEGQPLTVLEAMSEGLPVIATDRGCLRETVQEGSTGFIVSPSSPDAIAEKVLQLIRQPDLLTLMRRNARLRFEHEYTTDLFAARMEQVFSQTLSVGKGGTAGYPRGSEAS
jgi:glycosyltransferase involved in cell wall biosynthesis